MSDTVYGHAAEDASLFRIREVRDRNALDAMLSTDRAYAAYALAHVGAVPSERSRFWLAENTEGTGIVLHAEAMGTTMFAGGHPAAVDAILSLHPGPRRAYLSTCAPEHLSVIERTYRVTAPLHMVRMSTTAASFTVVEGEVRRLGGRDVNAINTLYATEGAPSRYTPDQIDRVIYYGAFADNQLVSVAGTHVVSPEMSIGVVGNVFTHPSHRGRGLATRTTARVTKALFDCGCSLVALTVDPTNAPAVRAYERLGYAAGAPVVEAHLERRDDAGIGAWLRRRRARSRGDGDERAAGRPAGGDEGATP